MPRRTQIIPWLIYWLFCSYEIWQSRRQKTYKRCVEMVWLLFVVFLFLTTFVAIWLEYVEMSSNQLKFIYKTGIRSIFCSWRIMVRQHLDCILMPMLFISFSVLLLWNNLKFLCLCVGVGVGVDFFLFFIIQYFDSISVRLIFLFIFKIVHAIQVPI